VENDFSMRPFKKALIEVSGKCLILVWLIANC
jgi:hypothetical protein